MASLIGLAHLAVRRTWMIEIRSARAARLIIIISMGVSALNDRCAFASLSECSVILILSSNSWSGRSGSVG
jgi:hypothetical protein